MKNKKTNIKRETPIRDGDTRPDANIEGKTKANSSPVSGGKQVTKERAADVNSLEDYKDAKNE